MTRATAAALCLIAGGALLGCGESGPKRQPSAARGHQVISRIGCGACHRIGGVEGADGRVGPSLEGFRKKRSIADRLPNSPVQVARWIRNPQSVKPGTLMPNYGLSRREAREVVDYLYSQ